MTDLLLLGFIFLVAGVLSVPIATRLGLGSVLGYLLAGIALSPLLNAGREMQEEGSFNWLNSLANPGDVRKLLG